jgi:nickel/cobalt exporter
MSASLDATENPSQFRSRLADADISLHSALLYSGMSEGLSAVAGGDPRAILLAMAAAILFGAVHALMPGHGKTVLVSFHLGQKARPFEGFVNGAIVAITHVGLAVVLVLAGFAVISRAFAYGAAGRRNSSSRAAS